VQSKGILPPKIKPEMTIVKFVLPFDSNMRLKQK